MSIYAKTGDTGETTLYGGKRIGKSECNVESYGVLDELTSGLGWVRALKLSEKDEKLILDVQSDLHRAMAFLAGDVRMKLASSDTRVRIFEQYIEQLEQKLPPLHAFILPGGGETASRFHIVRTVCRRAERGLVSYFSTEKTTTEIYMQNKATLLRYINRLSDLLFMMARKYSKKEVIIKSV